MYQTTALPNGVLVATASMPHMRSASFGVWVATGGRHETAPQNGSSHFIEHMLFKGTPKRSAAEISQAVEGVGGYLNAFTSEESTCFYARASHEKLPVLIDVIGDMFLNSKFDPEELEKERQVIKEEVAMYQDQPQQHVQELLNDLCWPDQPLGRPLTGTLEGLDRLTRASLLDYYKANYIAGATLITAAGQVEHGALVEKVSKLARRIPAGARKSPAAAAPNQTAPRLRVVRKDVEQTQLAIGIRACSRHDDSRFALRLLSTVLGENMSSRLFQTVREERGLAYSIYSATSSFEDVGVLNISAGLDTRRLEEATKVILEQLQALREKAPSAPELRRARDYVIGQMDLSLESTENQMTWLGETILGYGKAMPPDQVKSRLLAVTSSQVREVARRFLTRDRLNMCVIGPAKEQKRVESLLNNAF